MVFCYSSLNGLRQSNPQISLPLAPFKGLPPKLWPQDQVIDNTYVPLTPLSTQAGSGLAAWPVPDVSPGLFYCVMPTSTHPSTWLVSLPNICHALPCSMLLPNWEWYYAACLAGKNLLNLEGPIHPSAPPWNLPKSLYAVSPLLKCFQSSLCTSLHCIFILVCPHLRSPSSIPVPTKTSSSWRAGCKSFLPLYNCYLVQNLAYGRDWGWVWQGFMDRRQLSPNQEESPGYHPWGMLILDQFLYHRLLAIRAVRDKFLLFKPSSL